MLPAKNDLCPERFSMFQQKSRVLVLALLVLTWAPMASAAETRSLFDGWMQQLAVYLGLADEAGPELTPWGLTGEAGTDVVPGGQPSTVEGGIDYLPGGLAQPNTSTNPKSLPGTIDIPTDESGPDYLPGG